MTYEDTMKALHEAREKQDISIVKAASSIYHRECRELKNRVFDYIKEGLNNRADYDAYCLDCWKVAAEAYPEEGPVNDPKAYQRWRNDATETLVKEFLAILHKEGKFMDFLEGIRFSEFDPEDKSIDFRFYEGYGLWVTDKVEIIVN